jgi:hypothetical protein
VHVQRILSMGNPSSLTGGMGSPILRMRNTVCRHSDLIFFLERLIFNCYSCFHDQGKSDRCLAPCKGDACRVKDKVQGEKAGFGFLRNRNRAFQIFPSGSRIPAQGLGEPGLLKTGLQPEKGLAALEWKWILRRSVADCRKSPRKCPPLPPRVSPCP